MERVFEFEIQNLKGIRLQKLEFVPIFPNPQHIATGEQLEPFNFDARMSESLRSLHLALALVRIVEGVRKTTRKLQCAVACVAGIVYTPSISVNSPLGLMFGSCWS